MKIVAITTFNEIYYNNMAKSMVETFLHFWPKDIELHVWTEDFNIPVQAKNLKQHNVYDCPGLTEFLDWRGNHFTRGFSYKAYTFMHAAKTLDADIIIYLDADSVTYRPITREWILEQLPNNELCAYMGVTMSKGKWAGTNKENAETAIFWFNNSHEYAKDFVEHYTNIYESREIDDRERFPKPHDTWAWTECVLKAKELGHSVVDFHPERKAHSPLKETKLGRYFRHFKAARKNDPNKEKYIEKIIKGAEAKDLDRLEKKHKKHNYLKDPNLSFSREWTKEK